MGLVGCALLGLVIGVAALVARRGAGRAPTLVSATVGAVIGGLAAVLLNVDSLAAFFDGRSWALALAGALVLLLVEDGLDDGRRRRG